MSKPSIAFGPQDKGPHEDDKPWQSGWRGWEDVVDVHVNGVAIGFLDGRGGAARKADITYSFKAAPGSVLGHAISKEWPKRVLPMGRKAAKATLRDIAQRVAGQ